MADSDDILHASINPLAAKTGRQSVSEPSLQNLIRGAQVRDAFIPREGNVLIMADFDQIEVRLLAHFCGDPTLMAAINSEDIHTTTARLIYQDPTMVKSDPRRMPTKNATYARIYGAGVAKFAITAGISLEQARFVMNGYDDAYPGVPNFIGQVIATARDRSATDGSPWVRTPSGRRLIGDRGDEYKLVNYLIQGTAADVMKRQTIQCANAGLEPYMLMTVHDELLFDVPKEDVVDVVQTIMEVMPDMTGYKVPLTIGVEVHDRWGSKYRK
jgi:DNA polymerase-1